MAPLALWQADPADANPVVCLTSLEAPAPSGGGGEVGAPVEVSRCGPVKTTDLLVTERFYTWTAPFARGVDVMHQITDLLGIAVAGPEGNRVMGIWLPRSDDCLGWICLAIHLSGVAGGAKSCDSVAHGGYFQRIHEQLGGGSSGQNANQAG